MLFALNNLKQRVRATESGEKAKCPCCNSIVIGRKNIVSSGYHWYHKSLTECDSWYQPMSEWHYDWQMVFPFDWQEVICNDKKTRKKYIADIKLPNGVVIEFQHSPIGHEKLAEREKFYNKLI
jgi:competence CoiA-like predicted nuclease